MDAVLKPCQSCGRQFRIEPEDFDFYSKIDVPPPTWCPECRNMRRFAWREDRTLYKGACALCKKSTLQIQIPDSPFTVYCRDCWYSDKWDPMAYGRDYDFGKPFFAQYRALMEAVPRPALTGTNVVNSEYSHACMNSKNCYYTFWSYFSENSQYCYMLLLSRDTFDSYVTDNSDHVYEGLHSNRIYRVRFGYFSDDCLESSFLFNCVGCSDCFGCVNVRKKKYCVFNTQLSKEAYAEQMRYWDLGGYARLEEAKKKFRDLYASLPHRYAHVLNSVDVSGDIIRDSKNCHVCFSSLDGVEDCKFLYLGGLNLKNSYDVSGSGDTAELLYEVMGGTRSQRVFFSGGCGNSKDVRYSDRAGNCSDCFGCIGIKNKRYCILNKQYDGTAYENLVARIRTQMDAMPYIDRRGRAYRYGEFFPMEIAAYPYNESFAFPWYSKSKEEVLAEGWQWHERADRRYAITLASEDLPDHINDVNDTILKETIGCMHGGSCNDQCSRAFRFTQEELAFYRNMNIALPRLCPTCRYVGRLAWRNKFNLYRRHCMCEGVRARTADRSREYQNISAHFHGTAVCPNEFETTFAPEQPEMVYCEQCYKTEFL